MLEADKVGPSDEPCLCDGVELYDDFKPRAPLVIVTSMKNLNINVEKVARAIEKDAGQKLPGLRRSLASAETGTFAEVHKLDEVVATPVRARPDAI